METIRAANGIINPRYYQTPLDKIEAKQAMEPLAIATGMGPIIGFDVVDTTETYVKITGISNPDINITDVRKAHKLIEPRTINLTVDGVEGAVVNAHITPSGLMSIDPLYITTNILSSTVKTQHSFIIVKSKLNYISEIENNIENIIPPNNSNFTTQLVTGWIHNMVNMTGLELLNLTYRDLISALASAGVIINPQEENLIGIYEFNPSDTIRNANPEFYENQPKIIPLVPYYNIWPPRSSFNPVSKALLDYTKDKVDWIIENLKPEVDTAQIVDKAVTTPKIADKAVTTPKIEDNAVTTAKLATGAVTTAKIGEKSVTEEKISNNSVTGEKIKNDTITEEKIATDSITTLKIKNEAVTGEKLANKSIESRHFKGVLQLEQLQPGIIGDGIILLTLSKPTIGTTASTINRLNAFVYEGMAMGISTSDTGIKVNTVGDVTETAKLDRENVGVCSVLQFYHPRTYPRTDVRSLELATYGTFKPPATNSIYLNLFLEIEGSVLTNGLQGITSILYTKVGSVEGRGPTSTTPSGSVGKANGKTYVELQFNYTLEGLKGYRGSIQININM